MKRNFLILLFLALCCVNYTYAQQIQVTGRVTDANDNGAVPGVTVTVLGTSTTVMTDIDGEYSLAAPSGSVLRFSSIGYAPQEVRASSEPMSIVLEAQHNALDQVVVVGYGTQKKEHLTGAVSSVNVEDAMGSRPIPDVA